MKRAIIGLWRRHPMLTAGFGLAVLAALVFAFRGLMFAAMLWMRAEQPVEGWMTPHFIALAYGIEIEAVEAVLGLTEDDRRGQSLDRLAAGQGKHVSALVEPRNALIRSQALE